MKTLFLILSFIISTECWGTLLRPGYEFARATGMGNAFLALADDSTAIFYNPAALAKNKSFRFHILDTQILVDGIDTLEKMNQAFFNGQTNNFVNPEKQSLGFGFKPTFLTPYFGLSIYSQGFGFFNLHSLQGSDVDVFAYNDLGVALAVGIPFTDYFSFGFGVRAVQRSSIEVSKTVSELLNELGLDSASVNNNPWKALERYTGVGYGFPVNAGVLITLPAVSKSAPIIRFAGTVENIGGTSFSKISGSTTPSRLDTSYHFGSLLQYPIDKRLVLNVTGDFRDQLKGLPFFKTFHLGTELRHQFFGIRGGISEGYLAYGLSVEFPPHTKVHFSSFGRELGDSLWENEERFYHLQVIVGFNPW